MAFLCYGEANHSSYFVISVMKELLFHYNPISCLKAQSRASVSLLLNSRTNVILFLSENYKLCLYLLAQHNFHTFDRPLLMFFIVMVLVKCSISSKFATAVQSIRISHHLNNAMICDIIYSTVLFLGTREYCHMENEHHLC